MPERQRPAATRRRRPNSERAPRLAQGVYVGDAAAAAAHQLELSYPVSGGVVQNWEDMQLVWEAAFRQLGVETRGARVLLTDPPLNPTANRERMLQARRRREDDASVRALQRR